MKKILIAVLVIIAFSAQANADLIITPGDATLSANIFPPSEPNILSYISSQGYDLGTLLYKSNVGGPEEGPLSSSYETQYFNTPSDPKDAAVTYIGGDFVAPPAYLYVKDGNADPSFYLFSLDLWDGKEKLVLNDFWPGRGAISHVSLYGKVSVPEPATLLLLGAGLIGLASFSRRRFKTK